MSRRPSGYASILAALACALPLVAPPLAHADTCTGLSLAALAPAGVGTAPNAVAVGDFNRDGKMDVAVVNSGSSSVSILLGDGLGGFTAGPNSPIATGASNPIDIAAGDVDQDGILDLVVAYGGSAQAQVLRGEPSLPLPLEAPGSFDITSPPFPLNATPSRIYLGHYTPDADLDLVVLSEAGQRLLLYGGATGLGFGGTPLTDINLLGPPTEQPSGAAVLDFNRDGRLDLAVVMRNQNTVHVYFGDGAGGLTSAFTPQPVGSGPGDVAVGDINRDGWPDLVTANSGASTASVLFNTALGASLTPQTPVSVGSGSVPTRVALMDLDHDGVLDLAVLDDSGTPRVAAFRGSKTGPAWFDATAAAASLPASGAHGLAVGRFTADGRADLVSVSADSVPPQVVVVENQSGTPCARSSFAGAPRSYVAGNGPVSTAAADFNGDGRKDLVVATASDFSVRILRNANGDFQPLTVIGPLPSPPTAVATGDLNVDGNADVVVARGDPGPGLVQVYLGNGSGGLAPGVVQSAGTNTTAVVIGDFNGDGAPDVAATSEGTGFVYVFLGNGAGGLAAGLQTGVGTSPRALVAGFLDGNATLDLAVANFGSSTVSILGGNGDGNFTAGPVLGVGTNPQGIAAADLDGNGHLDVVTADNGASRVSVILRDGAGAFLTAVGYGVGAGTNPTAVALLDLVGGDAKPEIAVTSTSTAGAQTLTLLTNDGSGVFPAQSDHPVRNSPQAITLIDADTDGLVDLAIPCRSADAVVILINRPPGPPVLSAAPRFGVRDKPRAAVTGDFDGDGILDMVLANSGDASVSLLRGNGSAGFTETQWPVGGAGSSPESVVAGDFNQDGRLDLAISLPGEAPSASVAILFGSTTVPGEFTTGPLVAVGGKPDDLAVGDFDRDGDLDLAMCNNELPGFVTVLRNTSGSFAPMTPLAVGNNPTALAPADFDRDGDLDLAVANTKSNNVMILANSGGVFTVAQTLGLGGGETDPVSLAAADFDADGLVDLAAAAFGSDRLHVYRNQGASFATTPGTIDVPYVVGFVTAADVNLDGKPDLLAVAGGLSIFRGTGSMGFEPPQTVVGGHQPAATVVGDFNRDGRQDVAVVNEGSDDVSILSSSACSAQHLETSLLSNACDIGAPFLIDATVEAFDDGGNTATCATGSVSPSIVPPTGGAALGGPLSLPFTAGVASFTGANVLTIDRTGRYRLQFQTAGMPPVQSRSFTLLEGGTTQILGPASVCPGDTGVYFTNRTFDTYTWTLTPTGPPPFAYTPLVSLTGPPLSGNYTLDLLGRDECVSSVGRSIYFGSLASVTLSILGGNSVCVDCIGGSAKAIETGGGTPASRQWGYRTVSGLGAPVSIPGETGETYVLKGASFPGPGTYYVVVTTTPTAACGSPMESNEWTVTVDNSTLTGEVLHLAASSRGNSATGENRLLWVNTAAPLEIRIRWNKAPDTTNNCLPPDSLSSPPNNPPATDEAIIVAPPADAKDDFPHSPLVLDTAYCYSVFVRTATGWSPGRTVKARPFDSMPGPVKWAYATGGTAVAPPTVGEFGIIAMSNDQTIHSFVRGSGGGEWPGSWTPRSLMGVVHSRSPVVPFAPPLAGASSVLFAADDSPSGFVQAVDAETGAPVWAAPQAQGLPITGAPGGIFTQYGGIRNLIVVGTRHDTNPNALRGLSLSDGTLVEAYTGAGSAGQIGPISGTPAIAYPNLVYFASRQSGSGDTLFCLEVGDPLLPVPVFTHKWSRDLGDILGSPVLRGGRVYVGTESGVIYSLNALSGGDDRTFTPAPADGPVKGFLFPDRRNDDLIFATNSKVWSIRDDGSLPGLMLENWQWAGAGNPSVVLFWPQTSLVYVGGPNGTLYQLDFSLPTTDPLFAKSLFLGGGVGAGQIGAPSLDIGVTPKLLIVGSEPGVLYGVEVPFIP